MPISMPAVVLGAPSDVIIQIEHRLVDRAIADFQFGFLKDDR